MKLIIVAGPAGGGKTTWAGLLARVRRYPIVHTDQFKHVSWDKVPGTIAEWLKVVDDGDTPIILEGVRALSVVKHGRLLDCVQEVWWAEYNPKLDNCDGLWQRQLDLMAELDLQKRVKLIPNLR